MIRKYLRIIGMSISAIAMFLAVIFYGWKLVLILMLALLGNNLEQQHK